MVSEMKRVFYLILSTLLFTDLLLGQVRLKDITDIEGCVDMQLVGYGLVVGLNRTGDGTKSIFTIQSIVNMLERFGLNVDAKQIKPKNTAAVMVIADLSPYAKPGARLDVVVSSISDASSLQGGVLLLTPLIGVDGEVYVQAQGAVSIGGFNVGTAGGANVQMNHALAGRIPAGGAVLRQSPIQMEESGSVTFLLKNPDFTTASRVAQALDQEFNLQIAIVLDAGAVEAKLSPEMQANMTTVDFIAKVENLLITPEIPARVVINERTGTVVVGANVRLSQVAITHGALSITITPTTAVSQPQPFTLGQTVTSTTEQITVEAPEARMMVIDQTPDVGALAKALNALGVKPRDVIAIFQSLKESGALQAELIII
jgi:flagellar P-ring protein precursor FlgI